jgi:hypothetical protein
MRTRRADVVVNVRSVPQQFVEHVRVVTLNSQDLLPRTLVQHELQGERSWLSRFSGDPTELIVGQLPNLDAVIGDRLVHRGDWGVSLIELPLGGRM